MGGEDHLWVRGNLSGRGEHHLVRGQIIRVLKGKTSRMTKCTTPPLLIKLVVKMQPGYAEVIFSFNSPLIPGELFLQ